MFKLVLVYKVIWKKLLGTQFGLDEDRIPIQKNNICQKNEKIVEFQKFRKIAKIYMGRNCGS